MKYLVFSTFFLLSLFSCQKKSKIVLEAQEIQLAENKNQTFIYKTIDSLEQHYFDIATIDSTKLMDSTQHIVLLIGDSMGQGLKLPLKKNVESNGHQFIAAVERSSSIIKWAGTKKLDKLLKEHKANYVMISLGANDIDSKQLEYYEERIQTLVEKMPDIKFIWIGPPLWKKDSGMEEMMAHKIGKERYFDSKSIKIPRAGDGIHPTWRGYKLWADSISTWLMRESRHKIMLNPDTTNQAMYQ